MSYCVRCCAKHLTNARNLFEWDVAIESDAKYVQINFAKQNKTTQKIIIIICIIKLRFDSMFENLPTILLVYLFLARCTMRIISNCVLAMEMREKKGKDLKILFFCKYRM